MSWQSRIKINLQVADYNMHGRGRVIRGNRDMPAGFVASLQGKFRKVQRIEKEK